MQLQSKEKILFQGKAKKSVLVIWFFSRVLSSTLFFAFISFWAAGFFGGIYLNIYHPEATEPPYELVLSLFPIILPIFLVLVFAYTTFLVKTYNYYITNQRIIFEAGILIKKKKNIPYHKVTDTAVSQNIIEQMVGISRLDIYTAGTGTKKSEISFVGLEDAEGPQQLINKILRKFKSTGE